MTLRIVRLGSDRAPDEGLRLGTVRRPPRGVPKSRFATDNWYDLWYPNLSPSAETLKLHRQALEAGKDGSVDEKIWRRFSKQFRAEMATPDAAHTLDVLAALSHQADFSVGCYCADEAHCHRSILRELFAGRGAVIAD